MPTTRFSMRQSPAPTDWAIRMLAAELMPNRAAIINCMTTLALPTAVMAFSSSARAIQNWLIVRFSDCSAVEPKIGKENLSSVGVIGPESRRSRTASFAAWRRALATSAALDALSTTSASPNVPA